MTGIPETDEEVAWAAKALLQEGPRERPAFALQLAAEDDLFAATVRGDEAAATVARRRLQNAMNPPSGRPLSRNTLRLRQRRVERAAADVIADAQSELQEIARMEAGRSGEKAAAKRGRPPKNGVAAISEADRARAARERRAREAATRTLALAALLGDLTVSPTDAGADELITALAKALIGCSLDLHTPKGEAGPDAAFRAVVRSVRAAFADQMDGDREAAMGALRQATNEIDTDNSTDGKDHV